MSKKKGQALNDFAEAIILFAMAAIAFVLYNFFLLIFAPAVTYYVWRLKDKTRELEDRLARLEKPTEPVATN